MRKMLTLLAVLWVSSALAWGDQTLTWEYSGCSMAYVIPILTAAFKNTTTGCELFPDKQGSFGHGDICIDQNDIGIKSTCNNNCCCYWEWAAAPTVTAKADCSAITGQAFQKQATPYCTY
jgi:hypothetical protein